MYSWRFGPLYKTTWKANENDYYSALVIVDTVTVTKIKSTSISENKEICIYIFIQNF